MTASKPAHSKVQVRRRSTTKATLRPRALALPRRRSHGTPPVRWQQFLPGWVWIESWGNRHFPGEIELHLVEIREFLEHRRQYGQVDEFQASLTFRPGEPTGPFFAEERGTVLLLHGPMEVQIPLATLRKIYEDPGPVPVLDSLE